MKDDNCPAAIPNFLNSNELDPSAAALVNLGTCYARLGRHGTAWKTFRRAAAAASAEKNDALRDQAFKAMSLLSPTLTKLRIVPPDSAPVSLRVNGEPILYDGMPIPLDPGENVIEAQAPGREPWRRSVTATETGATIVIEVPELQPERPPERSNDLRTPALIVGGLGIAALATGAGFALSANSTYDDSSEHCAQNHCTQTGVDLRDSASNKATISTIAFVAGAVATGVGVTLWFWSPSGSSQRPGQAEPFVLVRTRGFGLSLEAAR